MLLPFLPPSCPVSGTWPAPLLRPQSPPAASNPRLQPRASPFPSLKPGWLLAGASPARSRQAEHIPQRQRRRSLRKRSQRELRGDTLPSRLAWQPPASIPGSCEAADTHLDQRGEAKKAAPEQVSTRNPLAPSTGRFPAASGSHQT